jgi:hypothetical protein
MNHAPIIMSKSQKNLGGLISNRQKPISTLVLPPASRQSGVDSITSASKSHNSHRTRTQNSSEKLPEI